MRTFLKTNFLADISHEMKAPLTLISGFAELSQMQVDENMADGNTSKNLSTISDEAKRLALLVDKLLDVSAAKEGATGLGLVICKEAVEIHGGTIDIKSPVAWPISLRSEGPGEQRQGTTVTFTLPIYNEAEDTP